MKKDIEMANAQLNEIDSPEYKFALSMTSQFLVALGAMKDKRPFLEPCLAIGGVYLSLKSKFGIPDDIFGHVELGFISNFTPAKLIEALKASDGYGEASVAGALFFATRIHVFGANEANEYGYNLCMTRLEDGLQAYFANHE
jgi:hypothetical protein